MADKHKVFNLTKSQGGAKKAREARATAAKKAAKDAADAQDNAGE